MLLTLAPTGMLSSLQGSNEPVDYGFDPLGHLLKSLTRYVHLHFTFEKL